jgi:hypothetical protein
MTDMTLHTPNLSGTRRHLFDAEPLFAATGILIGLSSR